MLKATELQPDTPVRLSAMSDKDKDNARGVATFPLHLRKGDAAARVQGAEDNNGVECYRLLAKAKLQQTHSQETAVLLHSLLQPEVSSI